MRACNTEQRSNRVTEKQNFLISVSPFEPLVTKLETGSWKLEADTDN